MNLPMFRSRPLLAGKSLPMHKLFVIAAFLLPASATLAGQPLDSVVAVVNEEVVLESEFSQAMASVRQKIAASGRAAPGEEALNRQVLEQLILKRLQLQRAGQAGISASDEELNDALNKIAAQNKMSLNQFARALRSEGIDFLSLRQQVRDELIISKLQQREIEGRVQVTPQDVDIFLEGQAGRANDDTEYRIAHILVSIPSKADAETRDERQARVKRVQQEIAQGRNFQDLAIEYSDSRQALQGGDLGWRKVGALPTLFAERVPSMAVGAVSDIIETRSGYHLIKVLDKKGGDDQPFFVNEVNARHILVKSNAVRSESAAEQLINDLRNRIVGGEDFALLAKEFSDDPGSANSGGDLDWQQPQAFAPAFRDQVNSLNSGEISQAFRSQFGWHIVQLIDRRERNATELARRAKARESIRQRKMVEEYDTWLRRLRSEAYVETRDIDGNLVPTSS